MGLNTEERQDVTYFIGTEVEHTAMKGEQTLFVVGVQPVDEIRKRADANGIKHLYFGTSQSFTPGLNLPEDAGDWEAWDSMIIPLLKEGYWCTLDFDVVYSENVLESGYDEYNNFIAMISVKLPYLKQFNYNATVKLDDNTWGDTNSGVWCHSLHNLMDRKVYTDWNDYGLDTVIE
jgi:hypothetical protein